ncbi:hypothetical protein [Comamonas sp. NoAH]|uniref:hypothetical protein n=1 Tax=Comamonas halotolerans TaxID=3041496 RepID=UPI0024E1474E|nr:hypothetical protein [Comamonas sp. NoAH]
MTHTTEQERAEFEAVIVAQQHLREQLVPLEWLFVRNQEGDYARYEIDLAFAAWQAARRAHAVLDGWKPVPEVPTDAMLCALMQWDGETGLTILPQYQAMLAAAPQPPEGGTHAN